MSTYKIAFEVLTQPQQSRDEFKITFHCLDSRFVEENDLKKKKQGKIYFESLEAMPKTKFLFTKKFT